MLTDFVPLDPVPPQDRWPARAARDLGRVRRALGEACLAAHHVGSTSVPGLPAVPVIDLVAEVDSRLLADAVRLRLMAHGFLPAPAEPPCNAYVVEDVLTGHRQVELRCFPAGHEEVRILVAFFAYVRATPDAAAAYDGMKRRTRARHGVASPDYHAAKRAWMRQHEAVLDAWMPR